MRTLLRKGRADGTRRPSGWSAARDDARRLAIEIGRGQPNAALDAMSLGFVLQPHEVAYRYVPAWLIAFKHGRWAAPSTARILVTDHRLVCNLSSARLASLPWHGLVGLRINLDHACVTLDYADGTPIALTGAFAPVIAVAAVGLAFDVGALLAHPGLAALRS